MSMSLLVSRTDSPRIWNFSAPCGEEGGEIMVRNSRVLISVKNLGETEFFACSCSNAAAQMRGTVLAGNNISNITGGRKTTGIK